MRSLVCAILASLVVGSVSCSDGGGGGGGGGSAGGISGNAGASGGTGGSSGVDRIYLGSCIGKTDGTCVAEWDFPVEGLNVPAIFESACTGSEGTYSASAQCSGGVPGCCTIPAPANGPVMKYCYKVTDGDPEGMLKKQCLDGFQGTWE